MLCREARSQLTVFNISSSKITDYRKIRAQQQFEIQQQVESSTTVTYGLGKGWEIGANLINIDYDLKSRHFKSNDTTTSIQYAPLVLINAQKVFKLSDLLSVGLGTVACVSVRHLRSARLVYYSLPI